ncbi:MAG: putative PEP-binding protein, partial [Pseudonocardia sediminis]
TEQGGPTSHTAILARSLGIPAVVGCAGALGLTEGAAVVVDGSTGEVNEVATLEEATVATAAAVVADWDGIGRTADGHVVPLLANVGDGPGAQKGAGDRAEGVGLFRTELAFLSAAEEPTEARQREVYTAVLSAFAGKPVTARTLDAGADKPLPFLSLDGEPNPALGVRGLRIARVPGNGDGVLDRQLGALAAAAKETGVELKVMAPMVATADEAAWFVQRCRAHGITQAGVMIEVPAAVLTADEILREVDFVSVGTNDLAQYLFAADRQSGPVAALNDPWQPALLRLIGMLGEASARTGTPVGVCGEAAADPALAPVLVGLGVASLSMGSGALAAVGAGLAGLTREQCRERARAACAAPDPFEARAAVRALDPA